MKKFVTMILACVVVCALVILAGCTSSSSSSAASAGTSASASAASASAASTSASAASTSAASASASASATSTLTDGKYTATFKTDSSMFHINEAYKNKVDLTVENGQMTAHATLAGTGIVKLFVGKKEDAKKDGAVLLEPTLEEVKFSDGTTDKAYSFEVPVPVLDEPFDIAILGEKGTWYDHVATVSNAEPAQ